MNRRCRLCKNPAVDESMFCDQHRSQAQLFSVSFGSTGPDERADEEGEEEQEGASDSEERRAARAEETPRKGPPRKKTGDRRSGSPDSAATLLAEKLQPAFEKIRDRAKEKSKRDAARWPLISIYCLHDKLLARPYYTIIPRVGEDGPAVPDHPSFAITDEQVEATLKDGGVVFDELLAHFKDCAESLKNRWLRSLDLHLLTYAGLIAINEHLPSQEERNLLTFALEGDTFVRVDPDDVKGRLRHERW